MSEDETRQRKRRGFASMTPERRRELQSRGGRNGRGNRQGFASMHPERQREIASIGGRAAHKSGKAHEWTSEEAVSAGRKGGLASSKTK